MFLCLLASLTVLVLGLVLGMRREGAAADRETSHLVEAACGALHSAASLITHREHLPLILLPCALARGLADELGSGIPLRSRARFAAWLRALENAIALHPEHPGAGCMRRARDHARVIHKRLSAGRWA